MNDEYKAELALALIPNPFNTPHIFVEVRWDHFVVAIAYAEFGFTIMQMTTGNINTGITPSDLFLINNVLSASHQDIVTECERLLAESTKPKSNIIQLEK